MKDLIYYRDLLGITKDSSVSEIKKAYRKHAKIWHPDRFFNDPEKHKIAEEKFKEINAAYEFLIRAENRENTVSFSSGNGTGVKTQKADHAFFYHQAVAIAESGRYEESLDLFGTALRLNPDYLEALEYRYKVLMKLGFEYRAAADRNRIGEIKRKSQQSEASKEKESKPYKPSGSPEEYYFLGLYQIKRKEFQKSIQSFSVAISLKPDYLDALKERKKLFERFGLYDRAIQDQVQIQKLQELNNQDKQAKKTTNSEPKDPSFATVSLDFLKWIVPHGSPILGMIIDHHKRLITIGHKKAIHFTHLGSYKSIGELNYHAGNICSLDFHRAKHLILTAGEDKTTKVFDLDNKKVIATHKQSSILQKSPKIKAAYFLPEDSHVAILDENYVLKKWDFKTDQIIYIQESKGDFILHSVSPDHKYIALFDTQNILKFRNLETGSILRSMKFATHATSVEFSKKNNLLAVAMANQIIQIWDIAEKQIVKQFCGHFKPISCMKFIAKDQYLITGALDGSLKIWSIATGKEMATLSTQNNAITTFSIADQGKTLVIGTHIGKLFIYRLNIQVDNAE